MSDNLIKDIDRWLEFASAGDTSVSVALMRSCRAEITALLRRATTAERERDEARAALREMVRLADMGLEASLRAPEENGNYVAYQRAKAVLAGCCEDCPPVGYPTEKTRCASCPRRATLTEKAAPHAP